MAFQDGQNKEKARFDHVIFHYSMDGTERTSVWDYGLPSDPNAGDKFLDDCRALGAAIWPTGRSVHVFMARVSR